MSLQAKTYLNLLAGGLAGLLAWALTGLMRDPPFLLYGAIFGLLLGLLFGIVQALASASASRLSQMLWGGAVLGLAGGWIGSALGEAALGQICHAFQVDPDAPLLAPGQFFVLLIGRSLGYGLIGGFVGTAPGVSLRSPMIARLGAFGGLLGGVLGGLSFEVTAALLDYPSFGRLIALVVTGALIGFFIGLVQNVFKRAWIGVVLGRNGSKEYLIAKSVTTVGCSEAADIGLYGDPMIAPTHLVIEALSPQNRHRLRFVGAGGKRGRIFTPPLVNGQSVSGEQWLSDGDAIQIGPWTLLFHEKATRHEAAHTPIVEDAHISHAPTPLPLRYVGQELSGASVVPHSPARATPAEAIAQSSAQSVGLGTRLVCIKGPYSGQSFSLSHASVTMGRAPDRDIALPADTSVSRTHARIAYQNGRHVISDDGSSNGTFVNGVRVATERLLSSGETIQMGDTALRYE